MCCREFEADIVDLARGAETDIAAASRASAHLEQCAGCAARFARERQLTTALKAMAGAAPASPRAAAIEAQLLGAFAERPAAASPKVPAKRIVLATPAARAWLAAAAVLVAAAAVWQGTARWRPAGETVPAPAQDAATRTTAAPPMAGSDSREPAPVALRTTDAPAPAVATSDRSLRTPAPPAAADGEDDVLRFVTLPTAIGLPTLESGRIVRVELQAAMLPAYGLDVTPGLAAGMVEADVLVGQDGQPRAIRFVTRDTTPRRQP